MTKRLLDYDADTGLKTVYEDTDDGFQLHYEQDAAPIIEANKIAQGEAVNRKSEMRQVAEIPIGIQYEWLTKYGINIWDKNHWPGVRRLLNSSDYRWLKTKDVII